MGPRSVSVRVRRGELFIEAEVFDPLSWSYRLDRARAPIKGLSLTAPKLGKKGGFKFAELRGPQGVVWYFYSGCERFYNKVKKVIAKAGQD